MKLLHTLIVLQVLSHYIINFINKEESNENLECITECELLKITKDNFGGFDTAKYSFQRL